MAIFTSTTHNYQKPTLFPEVNLQVESTEFPVEPKVSSPHKKIYLHSYVYCVYFTHIFVDLIWNYAWIFKLQTLLILYVWRYKGWHLCLFILTQRDDGRLRNFASLFYVRNSHTTIEVYLWQLSSSILSSEITVSRCINPGKIFIFTNMQETLQCMQQMSFWGNITKTNLQKILRHER